MNHDELEYFSKYHSLPIHIFDPNIIDLSTQTPYEALKLQMDANQDVFDERGYQTRVAWVDRQETAPHPFAIPY